MEGEEEEKEREEEREEVEEREEREEVERVVGRPSFPGPMMPHLPFREVCVGVPWRLEPALTISDTFEGGQSERRVYMPRGAVCGRGGSQARQAEQRMGPVSDYPGGQEGWWEGRNGGQHPNGNAFKYLNGNAPATPFPLILRSCGRRSVKMTRSCSAQSLSLCRRLIVQRVDATGVWRERVRAVSLISGLVYLPAPLPSRHRSESRPR